MPKFRKKPVVIEAIQYVDDNTDEIMAFVGGMNISCHGGKPLQPIGIRTLEGIMKGNIGDWIIKGVNGELYPCKPDVFAKTYELVLEADHAE